MWRRGVMSDTCLSIQVVMRSNPKPDLWKMLFFSHTFPHPAQVKDVLCEFKEISWFTMSIGEKSSSLL